HSPASPRFCLRQNACTPRLRRRAAGPPEGSLVQLQNRQECLCGQLHAAQTPHLFLAPPRRAERGGGPDARVVGLAHPGLPKVLPPAKRLHAAIAAAGRWPAGGLTRPASKPPGMPLWAAARCPDSASFSCPPSAFPAASSSE